ncbi:MAG: magnesium transporter CorA family protein [Candidatus Kuenenbacteria bacterium]
MQNIKEIKTKQFRWLDIINASQADLKYLKQEFCFNPLDLNDCLPSLQRPKIHDREDHVFIILQFPIYEAGSGRIESAEIDFFVGKNFLITIHTGELTPLTDIFHMYQTDLLAKSKLKNEDVASLLYKLASKLYIYCYPILNDIDNDISEAEKNILNQGETEAILTILTIKKNIVDLQKIMQSHFHIWQKFMLFDEKFKYPRKTTQNYNNLIDYTRDIWDYLKNYKDTINALHETQESITSLKINEIMKTLTIFSVVVFPLTLLAAIFGMNTMNSMPFTNSPYDFWYIIGIMLVSMIIMFIFFKKKKWL